MHAAVRQGPGEAIGLTVFRSRALTGRSKASALWLAAWNRCVRALLRHYAMQYELIKAVE